MGWHHHCRFWGPQSITFNPPKLISTAQNLILLYGAFKIGNLGYFHFWSMGAPLGGPYWACLKHHQLESISENHTRMRWHHHCRFGGPQSITCNPPKLISTAQNFILLYGAFKIRNFGFFHFWPMGAPLAGPFWACLKHHQLG